MSLHLVCIGHFYCRGDQKQAGDHIEQKGISSPSLKNVQLRDIRKVERLYQLFRVQHWISKTETNWRLFVEAAIRAVNVSKRQDGKRTDAVRVFLGIVKRRLWKNISISQEERGARFAASF